VTRNWKCQHCGAVVSSHDATCCCDGPAEYTYVDTAWRLERANATLDWAHARLETLLAPKVWSRFDDRAKREALEGILRSLDRAGNPKLEVDGKLPFPYVHPDL
jgi:hypothetical protein